MSTIEVDKIVPATGTSLTLGDSGDTFTIPSGVTLTNNGTASGFGKIGQVVSSNVTGHLSVSTSSSTWADIGVSASITPTSTSSKILILWKLFYSDNSGENFTGRLVRNSTGIALGTGSGTQGTIAFATANANSYWAFEAGGNYLDSPATTSSTTYKFQIKPNSGTYTMYFNRTARADGADPTGISTLTLMEILA